MPSWNIHIAQTEQLLGSGGTVAHAVRDRNAFLFGNVVPDILVGYMVPDVAEPIRYTITHFADAGHIPKPREWEFWDQCIVPLLESYTIASAGDDGKGAVYAGIFAAMEDAEPAYPTSITAERERLNRIHHPERFEDPDAYAYLDRKVVPTGIDIKRSQFDLALGVWAHLLADNVWNTRVNEFLDEIGGHPNEEFRIKKQCDFDWFGRTLSISSIPRATDRLYAAAEGFIQYPIERDYVLKTIGVIHEIVRQNPGNPEHPPYRLLNQEFFDTVFAEVVDKTDRLMRERLGLAGNEGTK